MVNINIKDKLKLNKGLNKKDRLKSKEKKLKKKENQIVVSMKTYVRPNKKHMIFGNKLMRIQKKLMIEPLNNGQMPLMITPDLWINMVENTSSIPMMIMPTRVVILM